MSMGTMEEITRFTRVETREALKYSKNEPNLLKGDRIPRR
jgi:hypothetical protein